MVCRSRQAVGGGEEGPPTSLPQLPPGTASRPACRFAGLRCSPTKRAQNVSEPPCRSSPRGWVASKSPKNATPPWKNAGGCIKKGQKRHRTPSPRYGPVKNHQKRKTPLAFREGGLSKSAKIVWAHKKSGNQKAARKKQNLD